MVETSPAECSSAHGTEEKGAEAVPCSRKKSNRSRKKKKRRRGGKRHFLC